MSRHVRKLFLLAGQSNMDGMGWNRELPPEFRTPIRECPVYHPNKKDDFQKTDDLGIWEPLQPGHGSGYRNNGRRGIPGDHFGPELSFAHRLMEHRPYDSFALFKYAKGGSALSPDAPVNWGCWDPQMDARGEFNQWTHFKHHYRRALDRSVLNRGGIEEPVEPAALIWLQGETDASYEEKIAREYEKRLRQFITAVRELTERADLPVVLCQISDPGTVGEERVMPWAPLVMRAQEHTAHTLSNVHLAEPPPSHGWMDAWHYDSNTYLEIGNRIADLAAPLLINEGE